MEDDVDFPWLLSADGLLLPAIGTGESTRGNSEGGSSSDDGGVGGRSLFTLNTRGCSDEETTPSSSASDAATLGRAEADGTELGVARLRHNGREKKWVVCVVVVTTCVVVVVSARRTGGRCSSSRYGGGGGAVGAFAG